MPMQDREQELSAREGFHRNEPTLRSIYVGELELLQLRRKIGSELTDHQDQALDQS